MVLSDVSEAMSGRQWVQVPHDLGVSPETASSVRRQSWPLPPRLQQRLREGLQRDPAAAVQREARPRQRGVPAVHQRQEPRAHERHLLGRASNEGYQRAPTDFTITEKAPTRAFSWLKAPTLVLSHLRHY